LNWKQRGYGLLSVFFYGYGAGFAAVLGYGSGVDSADLTLFNLAIYPTLAGLVTIFPKLGKTFAELSNMDVTNNE